MNAENPKLSLLNINVNKSWLGQVDFLGGLETGEYDVLGIQEPGFDFRPQTRSTGEWTMVYPKGHDQRQRKATRALIMMNKALDSSRWKQLPVDSVDVAAVEISGVFGKVRIFSIY
ncbi:hypothetical protein FIBSPDRAFT_745999, partial [Athelia psychrophila]